jgi:trans-aconitate methyltransferase
MKNLSTPNKHWDTNLYEDKHAFVWKYGEELLQLLNPQPSEKILDLGCGTGQLTEKIANYSTNVIGVDSSPMMIAKARENYPQLNFEVGDAREFKVVEPVDAVFSNATLHWIPEAIAVIKHIRQALKSGGRFVAEFGGQGNVKAITSTLQEVLAAKGIYKENPWYFPSIAEYSSILEAEGFDVIYAALVTRPTPLNDGDSGLANWIKMFATDYLHGLTESDQNSVISIVEERLKPALYKEGTWIADYRRLRVLAINN